MYIFLSLLALGIIIMFYTIKNMMYDNIYIGNIIFLILSTSILSVSIFMLIIYLIDKL